MIKAVNKLTGEIYDFKSDTPEEVMETWLTLSETIKALSDAKDKLKPLVEKMVDHNGTFAHDNYMFRVSHIQRYNYDKSIMRDVFDQDLYETLVKPDKTLIDKYLKENIDDMGERSTLLRANMREEGKPYKVIKLERLF